jgi:hypothetical protein
VGGVRVEAEGAAVGGIGLDGGEVGVEAGAVAGAELGQGGAGTAWEGEFGGINGRWGEV